MENSVRNGKDKPGKNYKMILKSLKENKCREDFNP